MEEPRVAVLACLVLMACCVSAAPKASSSVGSLASVAPEGQVVLMEMLDNEPSDFELLTADGKANNEERVALPVASLFASMLLPSIHASPADTASFVLYDLEGTLLPHQIDEDEDHSSWVSRVATSNNTLAIAHLQKIRSLGAIAVGLPSAQKDWATALAAAGVDSLLGTKGSSVIPTVLGSFGNYKGVKWAAGLEENPTTVLEPLLQRAIYVGSNSGLVDRILRKGVVRHAVWLSEGVLSQDDADLIEQMTSDLQNVHQCTQPSGDPTWSDFLCCAQPRCHKECCLKSSGAALLVV